MKNDREKAIAAARRIVVKLGSSVVTDGVAVDRKRIAGITAELCRLHEQGYQVVLVTSGARAAGLGRLGMSSLPTAIPEQQAAAAVGQISLMALYEEFFSDFGRHIGQTDVPVRQQNEQVVHQVRRLAYQVPLAFHTWLASRFDNLFRFLGDLRADRTETSLD